MNILHIAAHLGDGAGKAISGLAVLGNRSGAHTHRVLLLDTPVKLNHVARCQAGGVAVLARDAAADAIAAADVVVVSWWGGAVMDAFLADFPDVPCRVLLWSHKNGYFDPPFPDAWAARFDGLLATSPFTLEKPGWREKGALVYGFGDFTPEDAPAKSDYGLKSGGFTVGYVGSPSYKKLPPDYLDYCAAVIRRVPAARFVLAGEAADGLWDDIVRRGMSAYFTFPGWVSDVSACLHTFDVFGYLLRRDTFATTENAVLEAMAAAVPVVVSRHPLGKYLLEDGTAGFLANSPEEYGAIMRRLYDDEALRTRLGTAGRAYAIQRYNAEDNAARFTLICERAVRNTAKRPRKGDLRDGGR